jgi:hypothetical protein
MLLEHKNAIIHGGSKTTFQSRRACWWQWSCRAARFISRANKPHDQRPFSLRSYIPPGRLSDTMCDVSCHKRMVDYPHTIKETA